MAQNQDEHAQNPNERFSEDVLRIQESYTAASNDFAQAISELADCSARFLTRWAASVKVARASYEEYATIQPQLTLDWDLLSETQRQSIVDLDTNYLELDKGIELLHQNIATLRRYVGGWGPELSSSQQTIEEEGISIRDDLRRIHEIATRLQDDLGRRI